MLVKPDGYKTEDFLGAFKVHGITTERAEAEGMTLNEVMDAFAEMVAQADVISAFNFFFDMKLLKIGCARYKSPEGTDRGEEIRQLIETKTSICTMENAADHLIGKKRISLKNAYFEFFKKENEKAHESLSDCLAHREIFYELKKRGALFEPKPLTRRVYNTPPPEVPAAQP